MGEQKKKNWLLRLFDKIDENLKNKAKASKSCCGSSEPCCPPKEDKKGKDSCCSG